MEYDEDSEGVIVAIRTSQGNSQSVVYDALEHIGNKLEGSRFCQYPFL